MDNNDNKRGFSGLSDLASDVSGAADVSSPEPSSPPPKPSQPALRPTASNETKSKASGSPKPIETVWSGKSAMGSGWKWILGIIAVIFVIWLANNGGQSTKKPSYNPPQPSPSYNFPQSSQAPTKSPASSTPKKPSAQHTKETQQILTELGYDPGPIDGQYGRRTAGAVKAFQGDVGLSQDGWIDQNLLNLLTKTKALNKPLAPRSYNDRSNLSTLAQEIESGKAQAKQMEIQIKDMDDRLEDYERRMRSYLSSGTRDEYNMLIPSFNSLVSERNDLYKEYGRLIDEVNYKVKRYNSGYR